MANPYRPKITEGAGAGFNPRCNQATSSGVTLSGIRTAAEVAEEAMRKRAAVQAEQEAYMVAKEAAKGRPKSEPKRWLSNEDLA